MADWSEGWRPAVVQFTLRLLVQRTAQLLGVLLHIQTLTQLDQPRLTLDRGHQSRRTMSRPFCSMICGRGAHRRVWST